MIQLKNVQIEWLKDHFIIKCSKPEFRILQITDLHYFRLGLSDKHEMREILKICQKNNVDFVVNTGDMFGHRPIKKIKQIMAGFDSIVGTYVPWTFAWGNHDCENFKRDNFFSQFDELEAFFEALPHCKYKQTRKFIEDYTKNKVIDSSREIKAYKEPMENPELSQKFDGFYGGNFYFQVLNTLSNKATWNIFILNTRRWNFLPPQAQLWMSDMVNRDNPKLPALAFYHIPNYEFHTLWQDGKAKGIKRESVCYELDRGEHHNFLVKLGSIKACFVGHDHVNDYYAEKDGITYIYGRKTGIHGYGSRKKEPKKLKRGQKAIQIGAKLIILSTNSETALNNTLKHTTVFSDGK